MTIGNENRKISYDIDATSLFTYAYTFDIIEASTVFLSFFDTDGAEVIVTMARTTNTSPSANEYFVDKDASQVLIGGTGFLQTQYSADITQLLVRRTVNLTQEEAFPNTTDLQADSIEQGLDKQAMSIQQLSEIVGRALVIPIQDDTSQVVDLSPAAERASKILGFDGNGDPIVIDDTDASINFLIEHNSDGTHSDITTDSIITKDPWINVTHPDYGATGDGVTDDSAAIQAAWDVAIAAIKPLYIPAGTYVLENQIKQVITSNSQRTIIFGDKYGTIILDKCTTEACIVIDVDAGGTRGYFSLKDLRIEIDADKPTANVIELIDIGAGFWQIDGCHFIGNAKQFKNFVYMEDMWEGTISNSRFDDCEYGVGLMLDCPSANGGNILLSQLNFVRYGVGCIVKGSNTTNQVKFNTCKWANPTAAMDFYTKTILTSQGTSGQKIINIADTTGMATNQPVFIQGWDTAQAGTFSEVNWIASVDNGTTLTLRNNLANTYVSGSNFLRTTMGLVGKFLAGGTDIDTCHFETRGVGVVLHSTRGWNFENCLFSFCYQGVMVYPKTRYTLMEKSTFPSAKSNAFLLYAVNTTHASEELPSRMEVGKQAYSETDTYIDDQLLFTDFTEDNPLKYRRNLRGGQRQREVQLLSITTIDLSANDDEIIYTVPAGFSCILSHTFLISAGDQGGSKTLSIGQATAETDWIPANTLSNLDAANDVVKLEPIMAEPAPKIKLYPAGTVIQTSPGGTGGVAANTLYLYGVLI